MRKLIFILFLIPLAGLAQEKDSVKAKVAIYDGDTMLYDLLPAVPVGPGAEDFWNKYNHAKVFVPKIYYYAVLIKELTAKHDAAIAALESKKEKRKYVNKAKKGLKKEFGDDIREMSTTRSFYMIKLIDRETNRMAYDILSEYLGTTKATLWQGISRLGGADLKRRYDPFGEDGYIELVVREIEDGTLKYEDHTPKTEEGQEAMKNHKRKLKEKRKKNKKLKRKKAVSDSTAKN